MLEIDLTIFIIIICTRQSSRKKKNPTRSLKGGQPKLLDPVRLTKNVRDVVSYVNCCRGSLKFKVIMNFEIARCHWHLVFISIMYSPNI
jgi:hypothetical protein